MKDITTFDEHLDQRYGKIGTGRRTDFEVKAKSFAIGEIRREARKEADMKQRDSQLYTIFTLNASTPHSTCLSKIF